MQFNRKRILLISITFIIIACIIYFSGIFEKNDEYVPIIQIKDESMFENKIAGTNTSHLPPSSELSGYGLRLYTRDGEFSSGTDLFFEKDKIDFYISCYETLYLRLFKSLFLRLTGQKSEVLS